MTPWTPPRLEAPRLVLTWPTADQIADFHRAVVGSAMFDTIVWDGWDTAQELQDLWERRRARAADPLETFNLAVIDKAHGCYIGEVSLTPAGDSRVLELGYAFAPEAHGRGYATEAVGALVDHAFVDRGAERIFAPIFEGNHASRRVAEKVGLVYEGTLRRRVHKRGIWLDEWLLAVTRPDWEAAAR